MHHTQHEQSTNKQDGVDGGGCGGTEMNNNNNFNMQHKQSTNMIDNKNTTIKSLFNRSNGEQKDKGNKTNEAINKMVLMVVVVVAQV